MTILKMNVGIDCLPVHSDRLCLLLVNSFRCDGTLEGHAGRLVATDIHSNVLNVLYVTP